MWVVHKPNIIYFFPSAERKHTGCQRIFNTYEYMDMSDRWMNEFNALDRPSPSSPVLYVVGFVAIKKKICFDKIISRLNSGLGSTSRNAEKKNLFIQTAIGSPWAKSNGIEWHSKLNLKILKLTDTLHNSVTTCGCEIYQLWPQRKCMCARPCVFLCFDRPIIVPVDSATNRIPHLPHAHYSLKFPLTKSKSLDRVQNPLVNLEEIICTKVS